MSPMSNGFPVRALLKEPNWDKPKEVLLYHIHHDENHIGFATCWCPSNKTWFITNLGSVEPILSDTIKNKPIKKQKLNEGT